MENENEVQKLDAVLILALKCRHVFKEQEQYQEHKKCDNDLRHSVKQKIGPECDLFAQEYPHLFAFMCSSTTSEENVIKMQKTIEVKKQVIRGMISEEIARQLILSDLN